MAFYQDGLLFGYVAPRSLRAFQFRQPPDPTQAGVFLVIAKRGFCRFTKVMKMVIQQEPLSPQAFQVLRLPQE